MNYETTVNTRPIDYELLLTSLPGLYLVLSPEFKILEASDAYLHATLSTRKDIIGKHIFEAFPESQATHAERSAENLRNSLLHVLNTSTPHAMPVQRYDIPLPKKLGKGFEERYWLNTNYPIKNAAGQLVYLVHQVIDVTMQQMAHYEIKMHRERFELLAQATRDVIWDWDLLNNHIWWNDGFQHTFGFEKSASDFDIQFWTNHLHPDDRDRVVSSLHGLIQSKNGRWSETYRFQRADGAYATVIDRGFTLRDEDGIAYRMVGFIMDITDQLSWEQKLKASNDCFRNLLDSIPNLAWASEPGSAPGSRITYLNQAWYDYTGLPAGLMGGGERVIHPDDLPRVTELWVKSQEDNLPYEQELRLKNLHTGEYRWFLAHAIPLKDEDGKIISWLGTCTDIDAQKKLEEELGEKLHPKVTTNKLF